MLRGIYTASAGMVAQMRRQQSVANNLANAATNGYKQDTSTITSFPSLRLWRTGSQPAAVGSLGTGVLATGSPLDLAQGPLKETGRALDLALGGRGFFAVRTADGDYYTRAGSLQLRADGVLANQDGAPVLGEQGPITLPDEDVVIQPDGTVYAGGVRVDRLLVVDAPTPNALGKVGDNLLTCTAGAMQPVPAGETRLVQGCLEESNVDGAAAMVEAMAAMRAYEAAQRALQMQDSTLARAIDEVGKA